METECAEGYARAMSEGILKYGIPLALYSDKHTIFRSPDEKLTIEQELNGEEKPLSNFGKAMAELGIEHIKASTPQAKGRVERLWQTFQDRLPVEMRLLGIESIAEANKALPELISRHNQKHSVPPEEEESAYMPLPAGVNLDHVFAARNTRKINGGSVISYKNAKYVVAGEERNFIGKAVVEVRETYAGEVFVWHDGQAVELRKLDMKRPEENRENTSAAQTAKKQYKPGA
jgi:hypothetical protein